MRLRTFHATTMKEAMARVRAEMGPDAIIVYAFERKRGRGVEVRAAAEGPPPPPAERGRVQGAEGSLAGAAGAPKVARKPRAPNGAAAHAPAKPAAPRVNSAEVIRRALAFHGLPGTLATVLSELAANMKETDAALMLGHALDARLAFRPLPVRPPMPIMLVGGPGVGKTVTTAKLAARARLAGHQVRVVTTDTLRSGAIEQLAKLLSVLKLEPDIAETPEALAAWLHAQEAEAKSAVFLIDTPGTNTLLGSERADLSRFIKAGALEPVLVHAAGADCDEAAADAKLFAALGVRRMITTRLDGARRLGSLLAAADAAHLGIAEVSLSPYLSEPLSALTSVTLARILLAQSGGAIALQENGTRPIAPRPVMEHRVQ
jgi:flagellar biosynthesis protein FlhF